jgi:hypothetical protein
MARPIEPTPTLTGGDAARLLSDLERVCFPQESARRIELAKQGLQAMLQPKQSQAHEPSGSD